jgi:hypothetical protein
MAKLISLAGASCAIAFALPAPAFADEKPCCSNNGRYFESSPSTCRKYGGYVVEQQYCRGYYGPNNYDNGQYDNGRYDGGYGTYGPRSGFSLSFALGDVVFAYNDGYYDRYRRWHSWRNDRERDYFRDHRRQSYFNMRHDYDNDRHRRDWREGRRRDWNN